MLQRHDFLNIARKSMLVILCSFCFTSISLAQSWTPKAPMPTARGWLSTCTVDNYIYALGGALDIGSNLATVEAFDPLTNTWTTKTPMPTPRGCAAACALDGIIYVFGGGWYTVDSTVEAYDPSTDTWTTKSPMPSARSGLSVCVVDSIIYAISGFTDMNNPLSTNTVEAYDPKTDTWTIKAPIPTVRAYFSTSVVNGIIYTFGGFNSRGAPSLGNVEAYDPVTDVWTIKNDMPNPRAGMACYTFGGNIYCFGGVGYGGGPCYSTICKYDPASDTWEEFSDMPYAAFSISSSSLNGKLYLIGGLNNARIPLDIVYEYTPPPTNIGPGNVSGTWTKANSPYHINGEITIPNDSTLTIEPGVLVEFQGHYKFNVQGRLLAIGTETDTIVFTINDTTGFHHLTLPGGGWHGIKILDVASSNDSTILEYCTFQYGKANTGSGIVNRSGGAINTNLDKLRVSHCLFRYNKSYSTDTWEGTSGAILIAGNGIIESCEFSWNESSWGSAMCVGGNTTGAIIRNNHFHHNTGHGTVNIALDAYPIFINNIIEYNHSYGEPSTPHGHGILHFSNNNNAGYAKIINNTIVNNTNVGEGGGIFVRDGNPTFINNIVYGNEPSQVNFLWASSVGFYNCLVEGGLAGFTGAAFTGTYENCTDVDPLFVSSNDYHLQDSSPCIGAAIDSVQNGSTMCYCPPNDFEGNPRPNPLGSMPDIGAFENQYGIPTDINDQKNQLPTKFKLSQNFPNPFNPTTTIKYSIPKMSFVTIKIYDVLGSEVTTLVNEEKSTGTYEIEFKGHSDEGQNLTSGVYLYKLSAGNYVETKKMILLK